jgi:hypothetical protein
MKAKNIVEQDNQATELRIAVAAEARQRIIRKPISVLMDRKRGLGKKRRRKEIRRVMVMDSRQTKQKIAMGQGGSGIGLDGEREFAYQKSSKVKSKHHDGTIN